MVQRASAGEHGRDFHPVWVEGRHPWINGPTVLCDVRTSLRFGSH
jgi:hypothetical protein